MKRLVLSLITLFVTIPCIAQQNNLIQLETKVIDISGLPSSAKSLEMIKIPAGTFTMSSPSSEKNRRPDGSESPQHQVTISQPFYLGKYHHSRYP